MSDLLLDTCAVIWSSQDAPLSKEALDALGASHRDGGTAFVSPITAWELGLLVSRNRLKLTRPVAEWFDDYLSRGQMTLSSMSPRILAESSFLPGDPPADPADRIVIATARALNLSIVTRDRKILAYADEGHVRAIAC